MKKDSNNSTTSTQFRHWVPNRVPANGQYVKTIVCGSNAATTDIIRMPAGAQAR